MASNHGKIVFSKILRLFEKKSGIS